MKSSKLLIAILMIICVSLQVSFANDYSITEQNSKFKDIPKDVMESFKLKEDSTKTVKNDKEIRALEQEIEMDIKAKLNRNVPIVIMGNDPHCYQGPDHHTCYTEKYSESCGCVDTIYYCCCGKTIAINRSWCNTHGY